LIALSSFFTRKRLLLALSGCFLSFMGMCT
jgi:hypothetical protein